MGKQRAKHPFEDNPVIDGFLEWMEDVYKRQPLLWLTVDKDELKDKRNDWEDLCLSLIHICIGFQMFPHQLVGVAIW